MAIKKSLQHENSLQIVSNGTALSWFSSYIGTRNTRVSWKGSTSNPILLVHGMPQGSVLGLFCSQFTPLALTEYSVTTIFMCTCMPMIFKPTPTAHHQNSPRQSLVSRDARRNSWTIFPHGGCYLIPNKQLIWLRFQINFQKVTEHNNDLFGDI